MNPKKHKKPSKAKKPHKRKKPTKAEPPHQLNREFTATRDELVSIFLSGLIGPSQSLLWKYFVQHPLAEKFLLSRILEMVPCEFIIVVGVNWNIIRISEGMAGLGYYYPNF